jgi:hypothetical protein
VWRITDFPRISNSPHTRSKTADPKGESTGDEFATLEQCNLMAQGDRFQQQRGAGSGFAASGHQE